MDIGNGDVAAIHFLLGGRFDRFGHVAIGHGAKQHVVSTCLLLHGEPPDRVESGAERHSILLEGGLTLSFLGPSVLDLLHHRWGDGNSFAERKQEVACVSGCYVNQIAIAAQAEDVLIEYDLYALGHGDLEEVDDEKRLRSLRRDR